MKEEITCQELVEIVTDYLENRMPAHDRERFESHLAECSGCSHYLEHMRSTIAALAASPHPDLPVEVKSELLGAFRRWKSAR